jgi:hypothetical protein
MVIKHKLHKIALVSIALVLMLVSAAGAFPSCGCGCGCVPHSGAHTYTDESSDSPDNKCIVCPTCPTCPACNCPTCPAPALSINKDGNITGYQNDANNYRPIITYNYTLTNTGNVPLNGIVVYDNKTSPTGMPVTGTLDTGANVTVHATYNTTDADVNAGSVINTAYATAQPLIGNLINIISNMVSIKIPLLVPG